jgi:hypothetical protein
MDLRVEKTDLVHQLRPDVTETDTFHFESPPSPTDLEQTRERTDGALPSTGRTATRSPRSPRPGLTPFGISIGPFSTTKPSAIRSARGLAGRGAARDEPLVATAEGARPAELPSTLAARAGRGWRGGRHRLRAGGERALRLPRQMAQGSPVFDRFVVEPLLRLKALLDDEGVDLFLHDCGEPTTAMVEALASRVHPAVLSLGSSRRL